MKKVLGLIFALFIYSSLGAMHDNGFFNLYREIESRNPDSEDRLLGLLKSGINPNCYNHEGDTPLHIAIDFGYLNKAKILLDKGASANICNRVGETPVHWAAYNLDYNAIKFLIDEYPQINVSLKNGRGKTPLHIICEISTRVNEDGKYRGRKISVDLLIGIAKLLIDSVADLFSQDDDGNTALHYSVQSCFPEFSRCLILCLACKFSYPHSLVYMYDVIWRYVTLKNRAGKSALDFL